MSEVTLTREELKQFVAHLRQKAQESSAPGDWYGGYDMALEATADALEERLDEKDAEVAKAEADTAHFEKNKKLFFIVDVVSNEMHGVRFALTPQEAVKDFVSTSRFGHMAQRFVGYTEFEVQEQLSSIDRA